MTLDSSESEIKTDLATQIGHFSTAEIPDDLDFAEDQEKISPQQRSYCALRVRGFSSAAACRQLHVNQMAASRWANKAWYNPVCEEERKRWFEDSGIDIKRDLMVPLVGKAVDALSDSLNSEDEKVRLGAVQMVFETFFSVKNERGKTGPKPVKLDEPREYTDLANVLEQANNRIIDMTERVGRIPDLDIRANSGG